LPPGREKNEITGRFSGLHFTIVLKSLLGGQNSFFRRRIDYKKFRGLWELVKQFLVFLLENPFKMAQITGFGNQAPVYVHRLNKVVAQVHH
jgi:hypothetical protein